MIKGFDLKNEKTIMCSYCSKIKTLGTCTAVTGIDSEDIITVTCYSTECITKNQERLKKKENI